MIRMSKKQKSIIFDGGHGGRDPGASGFGVREKDWALRISLYQYRRMKELGVKKVGITRTTDKTLDSGPRTRLIKDKYDIAISNHWNASDGNGHGVETIHSVYSKGRLAREIVEALARDTGLKLRKAFSRKNSAGGDFFFMHRLTGSTTTVIVEYGFIDNQNDNSWYKKDSNFIKAAESVIKTLAKEIGVKYVAPGGKTSAPSTSGKSIDTLAREVIDGKHGSGNDRYKSLGGQYEAVQTRVNQILIVGNNKPAAPKLKSTSIVAKEVLAGKWGNGSDRRKNLEKAGYDYSAIQGEVNRQSGSSSKKSASQVADEIYRGKGNWGNGAERERKLRVAGYNPSEVQRLINRKF